MDKNGGMNGGGGHPIASASSASINESAGIEAGADGVRW